MRRGTSTRRDFVRSAGIGVPLWSTSNLTRSYAPEAKTKWTRSVSQTIGITRAISGIFYVITVDGIYSLTDAGAILWTFEPQRGQPTLFPTARTAYVAHGDTIIAFSTVGGQERWRYTGTDSPSVEAVTATTPSSSTTATSWRHLGKTVKNTGRSSRWAFLRPHPCTTMEPISTSERRTG